MKALLLISMMLSPIPTFGQAMDSRWTPLENEPSRQQLLREAAPAQNFSPDAIATNFVFPRDATGEDKIFGIDISHYTTSGLPFAKLAASKIRFVYVKATQGLNHADAKFGFHWRALGALKGPQKVLRGAYHFLSAAVTEDPVAQAESFVAYVNQHGGFKEDDMAPVMDLEWDKASEKSPDRWQARTPEEIVKAALAYLKRVEELTGKIPMIYTARLWWRERGILETEFSKFARYPVWVADYAINALNNESPVVPNAARADLWQFAVAAKMSAGYKSDFDANVFLGTEQEFADTFFNKTP